MKGTRIRAELQKIIDKPTGSRIVHIAGVEVQTVYYPASDSVAIFVLGEKMYSFDYAANTIYQYQVK